MDTQPLWPEGCLGATVIPGENSESGGTTRFEPRSALSGVGAFSPRSLKVRGTMKVNVTKETKLRSVCHFRGNREPGNVSKTGSDRSEHVLRTTTVLARD